MELGTETGVEVASHSDTVTVMDSVTVVASVTVLIEVTVEAGVEEHVAWAPQPLAVKPISTHFSWPATGVV